ncbi:MAG TPA: LLM class F420-dependent oxidoreductase [Candidatus Binataceae bacterium]|nr:LLM class F420-dependent oxidoreductase [Candidatus Binataceae bacterium]
MRLGFGLLHVGEAAASPDNIVKVCKQAESLGYESLYVVDRVFWALQPKSPYPASPDGRLPDQFKTVIDPLEVLAFAAAHTSKMMLGTSVMNLPYYNPVLLARQLTAIDVLSKGRLILGLGLGWSADEFEAVGTPFKERGSRASEALQVLRTIWTTDPVEFNGKYYKIPKSAISLKPVQKPYPPIYMGAFTQEAIKRAARYADGWMPSGIPVAGVAQMFAGMKKMAEEFGRDPSKFKLIVRSHPYLYDKPLGDDRRIFTGSADQLKADVAAIRKLGADELFFDVQFIPGIVTLEQNLDLMDRLMKIARSA